MLLPIVYNLLIVLKSLTQHNYLHNSLHIALPNLILKIAFLFYFLSSSEFDYSSCSNTKAKEFYFLHPNN